MDKSKPTTIEHPLLILSANCTMKNKEVKGRTPGLIEMLDKTTLLRSPNKSKEHQKDKEQEFNMGKTLLINRTIPRTR